MLRMLATPQIMFPYMSHDVIMTCLMHVLQMYAPAMDVQIAAQGGGIARSFYLIRRSLLNGDDGYLP